MIYYGDLPNQSIRYEPYTRAIDIYKRYRCHLLTASLICELANMESAKDNWDRAEQRAHEVIAEYKAAKYEKIYHGFNVLKL